MEFLSNRFKFEKVWFEKDLVEKNLVSEGRK